MTKPWWASSRRTQQVSDSGSAVGRDNIGPSLRDYSSKNTNKIVNEVRSGGHSLEEIEGFVRRRNAEVSAAYEQRLARQRSELADLSRRLDAATDDYLATDRRVNELEDELNSRERHQRLRRNTILAAAGTGVVGGVILALIFGALFRQGREAVTEAPATAVTTVPRSSPDPSDLVSNEQEELKPVDPVQVVLTYISAVQRGDVAALRAVQSAEFLGDDPEARATEVAEFWAAYDAVGSFADPFVVRETADYAWVAVPLIFFNSERAPVFEWVFWKIDTVTGTIRASGGSGGVCEPYGVRDCRPEGSPAG